MPYFGTTAPTGWLLCDGGLVFQQDYPALYAHLVANGQIPSGGGMFLYANTPNLEDRFIAGAGATYNLRQTGGSNTVSLTRQQLAKHKHVLDDTVDGAVFNDGGAHSHEIRQGGATEGAAQQVDYFASGDSNNYSRYLGGGSHQHTGVTGDGTSNDVGTNIDGQSGAPHENRPPFYALTYIIKT
jgi:microcystin-dependent protein